MIITELLEQNNMTKYRLSRNSNVPYTTLNDICSGKTNLAKCSAETVYSLAKELNVSMVDLLKDSLESRCSFVMYKSNVCHKLKNLGDIEFLIETLNSDDIRTYYKRKWYPECLYLLAMVDYVSRENGIEWCEEYDDLRNQKLSEIIYPTSVLALCRAVKSDEPKRRALRDSIPEFIRFNIVESEVRNVN